VLTMIYSIVRGFRRVNLHIISLQIIGLFFVGLLVIPNFASSVSFGAYPKIDAIDVQAGQSGEFELLFFSRSETSPNFRLSIIESPEDFVITYPEVLDLDSAALEEEYILISGEYVEAKVVKINAGVPSSVNSGEYGVLLKVTASDNGDENFLSVNTEKSFLLKINVIGGNSNEGTTNETQLKTDYTILEKNYETSEKGADKLQDDAEDKNTEGVKNKGTTSSTIVGQSENKVKEKTITGLFGLIIENKVPLAVVIVGVSIAIYIIYSKNREKARTNSRIKSYDELKAKYGLR